MKSKKILPIHGKERRWELSGTILTGVPSSWFTKEEAQEYLEDSGCDWIENTEQSKKREK